MVSNVSSPLSNKTILVTRSAGQVSQFTDLLQQWGATVLEMPALEIRSPSTWAPLDEAIAQLKTFDWLILTSANAVEYLLRRLNDLGQPLAWLRDIKIIVVGKKTAACLKQRGIEPDFIPPKYIADSVVEHFPERDKLPHLKILFPRVESGGRDVLVHELRTQGAHVVEVAAYQSGCPKAIAPNICDALREKRINIITFASSKTVRCFCQLVKQASQKHGLDDLEVLTTGTYIASIGPQTSDTCRQLLGRVDIEAQEYTLEGLTKALIDWADSNEQRARN